MAARKRKRRRRSRIVVEVKHAAEGLYQRELVKCGKPKCNRCRHRPAHGPYWYLYRRSARTVGAAKLISVYVGKELKARTA